jgi:hypothetical protein
VELNERPGNAKYLKTKVGITTMKEIVIYENKS